MTITAPPKLNLPEEHQFRTTGIMVTPLQLVMFAAAIGPVTMNAPAISIFQSPARQQSSALQNAFASSLPHLPGKERSIHLSRDKAERKLDEGRGIILFSSMALSSNCLMQEIAPTAEPLCLLSWKPGHGTI